MDQTNHIPSRLPGVRLIDAEYQHFSFPRHFHLEYHLGLLVRGRQRYQHQGESHQADTGDVLLMAPEQIHDGAGIDGQGYQIRVLAFDPTWLDEASRSLSDGRQCGLPPHQWLTQLRLERSLPRVLRGESLSEVALDLGFYDQAHFSRLFRRTYGVPPARLRSR